MKSSLAVACALALATTAHAQDVSSPSVSAPPEWQYGAFLDAGYLRSSTDPPNHLFRGRGTTPRVDEWDLNMTAGWLRKTPSEQSRLGVELTAQTGEDSKIFGFSSTAPNIAHADFLRHLGPTDVSYLAPVGKGLTIQGGIFNSLIGYDSLYTKDNFAYTRPWGADYTPYLMLGLNASYPFSEKTTGVLAIVNGYWHLAHANDAPCFVGQVAYKVNDRVSVKETVLYGSHQPSTAVEFWRVLSDTIVERKAGPLTTAFEYQLSSEKVDDAAFAAASAGQASARALWMSAQLPVHWNLRGPWSVTLRPEFAWDRDGRWITGQLGAGQTIKAMTTTLEYRAAYKHGQAIVRGEYRYDNSHGPGGGFFSDVGGATTGVVSGQHLAIVGLILTFDSPVGR